MSCWYIILKLCVLIYGLHIVLHVPPCKGIALVVGTRYVPTRHCARLVLFEVSQMGAARTGQRRTPGERPLLLLPPLRICCSTRTVGAYIYVYYFRGFKLTREEKVHFLVQSAFKVNRNNVKMLKIC
jgi:hypothetical protein